jgi:small subunit ribosomal protein S2
METQTISTTDPQRVQDMFSVGAHYGYRRSRRHPSTTAYILGEKNNVEIFDLERTIILLDTAKTFVRNIAASGKQLLFIGGKHEAAGAVRISAERISQPYQDGRWIGGTLTNLSEIRKRVERLETLRVDRERGALGKYTKKERLMIDREIEHLEKNFKGIVSMKALPGALCIVDPRHEHTAVHEAKRLGIPMVALAGSDCDISGITYPIVANDSSRGSITLFVNEIANAYEEGKVAASTSPRE